MDFSKVKRLMIPIGFGARKDVLKISIGGRVVWEKGTVPEPPLENIPVRWHCATDLGPQYSVTTSPDLSTIQSIKAGTECKFTVKILDGHKFGDTAGGWFDKFNYKGNFLSPYGGNTATTPVGVTEHTFSFTANGNLKNLGISIIKKVGGFGNAAGNLDIRCEPDYYSADLELCPGAINDGSQLPQDFDGFIGKPANHFSTMYQVKLEFNNNVPSTIDDA